MRFDLGSIHAREKLGMPDDWEAYIFECLPKGPRLEPIQVIKLVGACAPLREPLLGGTARDWKRKDKSTIRTAFITPAEHDAWLMSWEQRTGKCSECVGAGRVTASWSAKDGSTYRACPRCKGTGAAASVPDSPEAKP